MRFQADPTRIGEPRRYRGIVDGVVQIVRSEGVVDGLYKGAGTTVLRAAVLSGTQVMCTVVCDIQQCAKRTSAGQL